MSNPKKNFIYNIIYQILILIIPLITAPYLARVVGAEGVGIYSYTYSIVYYFMMFVLLGVNNYGNRTIAKVREDKRKLSKTFWEIYFLQLLLGIFICICYFGYLCFMCNSYKNIATIQFLFLVSSIFDINWLFFGLEEFKKTVTRNSIVKILTVILIVVLVREKKDLWIYTLIMSGMALLSQLIMWGFIRKRISFKKVKMSDILKHLKPNLILFIPVIAVSLYKIMDKIMLGHYSSMLEVGFYENAEKIVNIPMTFIAALGTVMLPRISNIAVSGDNKKIEQYISKSISFVMFSSIFMCMILIAIGKSFAPIYFGNEFSKTGILIMMLSTTLPFLSFANVIRTQFLIPNEKDNIYIVSVILGAIFNIILNIIFIPKYKSVGACIGTIVAEIIVMVYQTIKVKNDLPIKQYIIYSIIFLTKGLVMLSLIMILSYININEYFKLIFQVVSGTLIYLLLNFNYVKKIININCKKGIKI